VGPTGVLENRNISCPRLESNPDSPVVQPIAQSLYRLSYSKYIVLEINVINIKNSTIISLVNINSPPPNVSKLRMRGDLPQLPYSPL
jgi:hypothetical protein